jgi:hypothetical protein
MLYEAIAAALVALAVVALIAGPLTRPGVTPPAGADEPEELAETPKGIALSALREIEFDRATGKLSDEDYAELKTKYTAEALAVLRAEGDDSAARRLGGSAPPGAAAPAAPATGSTSANDLLETMIADRVRLLQQTGIRCPACGPRPESDALFCSSCGRSLTAGGCAECGAPLVAGSRFCESCGSAVAH